MADSTDWRVTISLADPDHAERAQRSFSEREVEEDVHLRLGRNIAVGAGDAQIFLYAGTENAAREAEQVARDVLAEDGVKAEFTLDHWHPIEERWESPGVAMPRTEAERQAEHQRLEDAETAELSSHREAVELARTLESEGHTVVRRWKFLVVGANNEDDARELAEHIRSEAPPGATVRAEPAGVRLPFIAF